MRSTAMLLLLLPVALAAGPGKGRQRLQPLAAEDKAAYTMLANENADLHSGCDFVLKNFDVRQQARDEEVDALKQSIMILSGAKGFLQKN